MSTNKEVFGQIAESWYRVRHWPLLPEELKELTQRWKQGSLLNIGCAHGPDFLPFRQDFKLYGLDSAYQMLGQAINTNSEKTENQPVTAKTGRIRIIKTHAKAQWIKDDSCQSNQHKQ